MATMTIHRALSELKLIDARILKQISEITPVGMYQKDKPINNVINPQEFTASAKSKWDSINSLLERKIKIKSAINQSNVNTNVSLGGKTYNITEAINFKLSIPVREELVKTLKARLSSVTAILNKNNEVVDKNANEILKAALGKDSVDIKKDDVDSILVPFKEKNEFKLYDPLEIQKKIDDIEKEISEFKTEIDATLSEKNSITTITVPD
jgi:hypothetical protein